MTWLDSLKSLSSIVTRKVPSTVAETVYAEPVFLKKGKWVMVESAGVGIVTDLSSSGVVGIDFSDSQGLYLGHQRVPAASVLLAKYLDIPESRRPFSKEYAAQLGYN